MNRRDFMAAAGGVSAGAVGFYGAVEFGQGLLPSGGNNSSQPEREAVQDTPQEVEAAQPLANDVHDRLASQHNGTVYIRQDGWIIMEFNAPVESGQALKQEFERLAVEYAKLVKQSDIEPRTFMMVVDEVQSIIPDSTIEAYNSGTINKEAFKETIGVSSIERRSGGE